MFKRQNQKISKLLILLISTVFALLFAEILSRYIRPAVNAPAPPREIIHRISSVPCLNYELIPNISITRIGGNRITTNSYGIRGNAPIAGEDSSLLRIVALGDSVTFGLGVSDEDTYPAQMKKMLNESAEKSGLHYDVLNFGVSGYSTKDEALVLQYKVLKLKPDLVIIGYVLNDPDYEPNEPLQNYFRKIKLWQNSNLYRLVSEAKKKMNIRVWGKGNYYKYLHSYPDTWKSVENAFDNIKYLSQRENFSVMVLIFPTIPGNTWENYQYKDIHRKIASTAQKNGFEYLDLLNLFSKYEPDEVRLRKGDWHPNKFAYSLVANTIKEKILSEHSSIFKLRK